VIVLAYSLRGSTGFGGAAAAMPLLGLAVPMKVLVPAWTVLTVCAGISILGRESRHIDWPHLRRLIGPTLVGIAFGLYLFNVLDSRSLQRALGVLVVLYGAFSLRAAGRPPPGPEVPLKPLARAAGLLGGAVGSMFGALSSLCFAMYFDAIRMPKDQFRATMSVALVAMGIVCGIGYLATGDYTADSLLFLAMTLPMTLIGIYIGDRVGTELNELTFRRVVSLTLIVSGFALLLK
jgi:uncharacterized membrane protein YfcA